ncbi:hypothetical protein ACFQPC_10915 [Herminiimonas glaciei]|uniref:Uncharacterized protein n=1 Tax=Herminiimonas glaciei TaxID=523788 RepID=A0ABW2IC85_9BURK|nr:hypothetical protein [Janthinobacterium sp. Marseille]
MKFKDLNSWHLTDVVQSAKKVDADGDLAPIAAFVVGAPLVTLGAVTFLEILFAI